MTEEEKVINENQATPDADEKSAKTASESASPASDQTKEAKPEKKRKNLPPICLVLI